MGKLIDRRVLHAGEILERVMCGARPEQGRASAPSRRESHLHHQFIQTFRELEALQARRTGQRPSPLARLDVSGSPLYASLKTEFESAEDMPNCQTNLIGQLGTRGFEPAMWSAYPLRRRQSVDRPSARTSHPGLHNRHTRQNDPPAPLHEAGPAQRQKRVKQRLIDPNANPCRLL